MMEQEWNPETDRRHLGSVCPFFTGLHRGRNCRMITTLPPGKMLFLCGFHFDNCAEYKMLMINKTNHNKKVIL